MERATAFNRVLVTGAAGFIGSHTVDRLLDAGATVLGIDDFSTGNEQNLEEARGNTRFAFEKADVAEPSAVDALASAFRPQTIVHLAALVSVPAAEENPAENYRLNVSATQCVAEAARVHGVARIVFASSAAVYGGATDLPLSEQAPVEPISQYGAAKRMSEVLLTAHARSFGTSTVCFRYFNVFGPRQDPRSPYSGVVSVFAERYRSGRPPTIYGDGEQTRDFVYVGDVAEGNARAAMESSFPGGIYNGCTGRSRSLRDLVEVFAERYPEVGPATFADARAGDIRHSRGDPSKAVDVLGLEANTEFAEGVGALLESLGEARRIPVD